MRKRSEYNFQITEQDWFINVGDIQILIEKVGMAFRNRIPDRLQMFSNEIEDLIRHPPDEQGYRLINEYRVREIFAGKESLTSLLTQYMERTVTINY